MSIYKNLQILTDENFILIFNNFTSAAEYLRSVGCSNNGRYVKFINDNIQRLNLKWKPKETALGSKECPGCNTLFKPTRRTQTTCSKGCSNKVFRSGINHYSYYEDKPQNYRTICFANNDKECIVCGEKNIVAVHHYDEDHNNNDVINLVPLCPTHHQYMHSKYKVLIQDIVESWRAKIRQIKVPIRD